MKKPLDYKSIYQKWYKNIPNIVFWSTLITFLLASLVGGILMFAEAYYEEDYVYGALIILGGSAVSWGIAKLSRLISSIAISQKVVVADTLLDIKNGSANNTTVVDDELPEL